ncbi:MAG TPA: HD domain-containing phosphohydrolase [Candidatus Methylacidiphilales bacterium]
MEPDLAALFSGAGSSPAPAASSSASASSAGAAPKGKKRSLMVVDDDPGVLQVARALLGRLYEVEAFPNGEEALAALQGGARPDVVVSDQRMAALSGTELIAKGKALLPDTVFAIMTGYGEIKEIITGVARGQIYLYIAKPWQPSELLQAVRLCFQHRELNQDIRRLSGEADVQEDSLSEIRGDLTGVNRDFFLLRQKARSSLAAAGKTLGTLLAAHEGHYHENHAEVVARIAVAVAEVVGFRGEALADIEMAALLHDIGKAELPEAVRTADPETLRGRDLEAYESHVARGVAMLGRINRFDAVREIVAQHHERGDGSGFPNRLPLRLILREAQIVALADAYHNLTGRLTPAEWAKKKAGVVLPNGVMDVAERQQNAAPWFVQNGGLFDPIIYKAFLDVAASGRVPGFKLVVA